MFIPYKDDNPRILVPYVTWTLLAINVLVFVLTYFLSQEGFQLVVMQYGTIPARMFTGQPDVPGAVNPIISLFTSMFLHGGGAHLLGNMVFLYVFADNVESILGHRVFLLYYLVCGIAATLIHALVNTASIVPMIGASGAISGIMAGYMLKYPSARIHVLVVIFPLTMPAFIVVGFWFLTQITNGLANWSQTGGGVAWFAHIGGFIAGSGLMYLISRGRFYWRKS